MYDDPNKEHFGKPKQRRTNYKSLKKAVQKGTKRMKDYEIDRINADFATKISGKYYSAEDAEKLRLLFRKITGSDEYGLRGIEEEAGILENKQFFESYLTVLETKIRVLSAHRCLVLLESVKPSDFKDTKIGTKMFALRDFSKMMRETQQNTVNQFNFTQINNLDDVKKIRELVKKMCLESLGYSVVDAEVVDKPKLLMESTE